ncbi:hypothetical protein EJB05_09244, partial [Eragrostis curvula]
MEQWKTRCFSCGGKAKVSSSTKNKTLVGFVFSHDESSEGGDDGFNDSNFIFEIIDIVDQI